MPSAGLGHDLSLKAIKKLSIIRDFKKRLTCQQSTSDVKSSVTVGFMALDTGPDSALLANPAAQLPTCRRNVINAVDRLEKDRVSKSNLGNPKATNDMSPTSIVRLLESSAAIGA